MKQSSGVSDTLYGVQFLNTLTGWAVGGSNRTLVLATTNGGASWDSIIPAAYAIGLKGVSFTSKQTGWVTVGWNVPVHHVILHTADGGSTWIEQRIPPPPLAEEGPLNRIFFKDSLCGWVGGGSWGSPICGVLYHTTDGGANWTLRYTWLPFRPPPWDLPAFEGIDFSRDTPNGWVCGEGINDSSAVVDEMIIHTSDDSSWSRQYRQLIPNAKGLKDIAACDSLHVWAVGRQGFILRTTNGRTWSSYPSGVTDDLFGVDFVDTADGYACGANGTILKYSPGVGVDAERAQATVWPGQYLRAAPNPFASFTMVPGHERERFALFDITGRVIGSYRGDRVGENVAPGVYFLQSSSRDSKLLRVVKMK